MSYAAMPLNMRNYLVLIALLLILGALSGCSLFSALGESVWGSDEGLATKAAAVSTVSTAPPADTSPTTNAALPAAPLPADTSASHTLVQSEDAIPGIEVTWKVPEQSAPAYVIYFGDNPHTLSSRVEVATARLETVTDPAEGMVYRYVVPDVPARGELFVSVATFDGVTEGPQSEALAVSAE